MPFPLLSQVFKECHRFLLPTVLHLALPMDPVTSLLVLFLFLILYILYCRFTSVSIADIPGPPADSHPFWFFLGTSSSSFLEPLPNAKRTPTLPFRSPSSDIPESSWRNRFPMARPVRWRSKDQGSLRGELLPPVILTDSSLASHDMKYDFQLTTSCMLF